MGLGMTVTLVVFVVVVVVAILGYFMDASVPDNDDDVEQVQQVGGVRW